MSVTVTALDAAHVAAFLADHPDFFIEHESLLLKMHLPHTAPGAISLVERQASLLRERVALLERTLHELHAQALANEDLTKRMHRLTLALLAVDGPCELVETVRARLCTDFNLAGVLIAIEEDHALPSGCIPAPHEAAWKGLFDLQSAQVIRFSNELRELLKNNGLPETGSLAAIPLRGEQLRGAMLLVKHEPQGFRPDMGTLFLDQIGELVSTAMSCAIH